MDFALLEVLRCPFCGSGLTLPQSAPSDGDEHQSSAGILSCCCRAYPVVSGIPCLRASDLAERALALLQQGEPEEALFTLLRVSETERPVFQYLLRTRERVTFRQALEMRELPPEEMWRLYRFSDTTFLSSRGLVHTLGQDRRCVARRAMDLGGGYGHLARAISEIAGPRPALLADRSFRALWFAKRFVAPGCEPICCDAREPLPLASETVSLLVCCDAFHYIKPKYMLAREMVRLVSEQGVILLSHVHNAWCHNYGAGTPLTPAEYRRLFPGLEVRLFKESVILRQLLGRGPLDLSGGASDDELSGEAALILIATRLPGLFRVYDPPEAAPPSGARAINPLYRWAGDPARAVFKLHFPTAEYEREFADCKLYLPEQVEFTPEMLQALSSGELQDELRELAERYVLLDVPEDYL